MDKEAEETQPWQQSSSGPRRQIQLAFGGRPGALSFRDLSSSASEECTPLWVHFALRQRKRDGLLGTGTGGEGDERVKVRPRILSEKGRRDRGPPPEQWKC